MNQIIVYTEEDGGVAVCTPTGELSIEEVLAKDCPAGAIIIDDSALPQGAGAQFQEAWELNGTTITVNFDKAKVEKMTQFNSAALTVAQKRQANTLIGIPNIPDDSTWMATLTTGRNGITTATTLDELAAINNPV
jgi:hypothetical protein